MTSWEYIILHFFEAKQTYYGRQHVEENSGKNS